MKHLVHTHLNKMGWLREIGDIMEKGRTLMSLAVNLDWNLQQYDIKHAFLHGDLEEEIYMYAPPGYENTISKNRLCKLKKALYGLKQSLRAWFGKFTQTMKLLGYI